TGTAAPFEVVALDAANKLALNYTVTVHFTATDGSAMLPTDYTFVAGDHGAHTFSATWQTTATHTITPPPPATTSTPPSPPPHRVSSPTTRRRPPAPTLFPLTPSFRPAAAPAPVEVVALDASNHLAFNYTGTVHFTSTDMGATLPADFTFTTANHGFHF